MQDDQSIGLKDDPEASTATGSFSLISLIKRLLNTGIPVTGLTVTADTINLDTADIEAKLGIVTETAPATDTASSGLNGRLQRIAQRLTTMLGIGATATPSKTALTASTSATILAANAARVRFHIRNPLATPLYVRLGAAVATAATDGHDIVVPAGGQYISVANEYAGQIRAICATAGDVGVTEIV